VPGFGIINVVSTNTAYISLDSPTATKNSGVRLKHNGADIWTIATTLAYDTDLVFEAGGVGDVIHFTSAGNIITKGGLTINTSTPTITLNDTGDAGAEVAIRVNGEDFEIIEPEDTNKVWFKLNDTAEDGYIFGSKVWTAANFAISGAANRVAFYTTSGTLTTLSYSNYFQWDNTASVFSVSGPNADVYTSVLGKNAVIADGDTVRTRFGDSGGGFLGHVGYQRTSSTVRGMSLRSMDNIYFEVDQAGTQKTALSLVTSGGAQFSSLVAINGVVDNSGMLTVYNDTIFGMQFVNYGTAGTTWQIGPTNTAYGAGAGKFIFTYGASSVNSILTLIQATKNVSIGTTDDNGYRLDVVGTTRISGVLTLSSTISNGTYTYTLPSATGTLALTTAVKRC
jgi:hypothetical protein